MLLATTLSVLALGTGALALTGHALPWFPPIHESAQRNVDLAAAEPNDAELSATDDELTEDHQSDQDHHDGAAPMPNNSPSSGMNDGDGIKAGTEDTGTIDTGNDNGTTTITAPPPATTPPTTITTTPPTTTTPPVTTTTTPAATTTTTLVVTTTTTDGTTDSTTDGGVGADPDLREIVRRLRQHIDADPSSDLADKLEDVVGKLETAIRELNKNPADRVAAAGAIEGAVGDLEAAITDGLFADPADGVTFAGWILDNARQLAVNEIDASAGGDQGKLDEAATYLAEGDRLRRGGNHKDAAAAYKNAVSNAAGA